MLVNVLITTLFFSLIVYHNHFGIIATSQVLDQVKQVGAVKKSIFSVLRPQYMLIFVDIIVISLVMFRKQKALDWKKPCRAKVTVKRWQSCSVFPSSFVQ